MSRLMTRHTLLAMVQGHRPTTPSVFSAAQDEFFGIYRPVILAWCLRRGLDNADAEDVSQDVAVRLIRGGLRTFQPGRRFRPWLRRVVRNAVNTALRKAAGRPRPLDD